MFSSIGDLPLHPLVLHAAVLGLPVTLLLAILFAVPRTRGWARWPLAVAGVGSLVAVFLAKESGEALQRTMLGNQSLGGEAATLVIRHSELADQLFGITVALTVVAVASAVLVGRVGGTAERRGSRGRDIALLAVLLVLAAVAAFWVYRVGDLGATAVWNPSGTQDYSSAGR
ncbi:DUF2231 domain-containing protein [Microlunatus capsulatus]|uniref:Uncharacterized BrkB/YihY/UPF0761 family membrane protein n=1 Tax=Microlunatus capsulatus TaxID=99117 RepID=A0ABS4Z2S1_9ACTN|nr:DUF2231 domain-containing protein [Microlunatus capsulatus]MBP2415296.1 uncharacterized BrkB/YihY/UPF0761 family membrane protein [Microlunatus capsulatus]